MSTWDEVDGRVLRWLLDQDSDPKWEGRLRSLTLRPEPEPQPAFGSELDSRQVDDALRRLRGHELIAGERGETIAFAHWHGLRLKANGLILLGQWPDLARVATAQGLTALMARLANEAGDAEDKTALRQTAGAIGRLGEDIVDSAIESLGSELGS